MTMTTRKPCLSSAGVLLLGLLCTACQSMPTQTAMDLERLQGHWEGQGPGGAISVTISDRSLRYTQPNADPEKPPSFWYDTTFTLIPDTDPKQLHATIVDNVHETHIGTVVVTIFKIEGETLTLGVVEDFEAPPTEPIVGDWDWAFDQFVVDRVRVR